MADATPQPQQRPACQREDALAVLHRLRDAGHVAYFAGGCVRDQLLGLEPKDWDVATDAPPDRVRQLFSNTQAVGAAFGVILVKHRKSTVEVATFRTDLEYKDGRRPEGVRFTTAEEDAKRRDFTINGLFQDPIENRIIDYVGGQADLKSKVLRAIGEPDQRFEEDHLRLLRAVRFAARFGLTIEPRTAGAIRAHAPQLVRISPERIADELRRMLTPPSRDVAWSMLFDLRLTRHVIRWVGEKTDGALDARRAIFPSVARGQPVSFGLALAAAAVCRMRQLNAGLPSEPIALLVGREPARVHSRGARTYLRVSGDEDEWMTAILIDAGRLLDVERDGRIPEPRDPDTSMLLRFLAKPTAPDTRALLRGMAEAGIARERVRMVEVRLDELAARLPLPAPFITGDDLTAAGLAPGPVFKRVLDAVYDAQLEDRVGSKDEAMGLALRLAGERAG